MLQQFYYTNIPSWKKCILWKFFVVVQSKIICTSFIFFIYIRSCFRSQLLKTKWNQYFFFLSSIMQRYFLSRFFWLKNMDINLFAHYASIDFGNLDERDRFSKYLTIQSRNNASNKTKLQWETQIFVHENSIFHLSNYLISNNIKAIILPALGINRNKIPVHLGVTLILQHLVNNNIDVRICFTVQLFDQLYHAFFWCIK